MSGYHNYSKSNNAVSAEMAGRFPATHAAKLWGFKSAAHLRRCVSSSEWHHSSKYYNIVDYYDVESFISEYYDHGKRIASLVELCSCLTKRGKGLVLPRLVRGITNNNLLSDWDARDHAMVSERGEKSFALRQKIAHLVPHPQHYFDVSYSGSEVKSLLAEGKTVTQVAELVANKMRARSEQKRLDDLYVKHLHLRDKIASNLAARPPIGGNESHKLSSTHRVAASLTRYGVVHFVRLLSRDVLSGVMAFSEAVAWGKAYASFLTSHPEYTLSAKWFKKQSCYRRVKELVAAWLSKQPLPLVGSSA